MNSKSIKRFMKKNSVLKLFLTLFMFISIFSASAHSRNINAIESNTGSVTLDAYNKTVTVKLYNFDKNSLDSFNMTLKLGDNVIDTWSGDSSSSTFADVAEHVFTGLIETNYTLEYELNTVDDNSVYYHLDDTDNVVYFYNTKRLVVTKAWDDDNNALQIRPSAESFKNMLEFYVGGTKVTPRLIDTAIDGKVALTTGDGGKAYHCYVYHVYGIDIRNGIEVKETGLEGYQLESGIGESSSTQGLTFVDEYGEHVNKSSAELNVSTPGLANTTNFTALNIKLKKVDEETNAPLANVEFEIINKSGSPITYKSTTYQDSDVIETIKTDSNGEASIMKLLGSGTYLVKESKNPNKGYESPAYSKEVNFSNINQDDGETVVLDTITNKKADPISVSGKKTWVGDENALDKRPASITINLMADGEPALDDSNQPISKVVTADDGWEYTFENLPKSNGSTDIVYTVEEVPVEGYGVSTVDGMNLKNVYNPNLTSVSGQKNWVGDLETDRPDSITINLLANDEPALDLGGQPIKTTTTASDEWKYEFVNIPKLDGDNNEIIYTVTEDEVDGYDVTYDGYNITNTKEAEYVNIKIKKVWEDDNNADKLRPNEISVDILAGNDVIETVTLNEDNEWSIELENMPKIKDNALIEYDIKETKVPDKYTVTYNKDAANYTFTVTNTYKKEDPPTPPAPKPKPTPTPKREVPNTGAR